MNFEPIAENIIKKTISAGATDCDVVLAEGSGKSISCRLQKIEDIEESNDKTLGINWQIPESEWVQSEKDKNHPSFGEANLFNYKTDLYG